MADVALLRELSLGEIVSRIGAMLIYAWLQGLLFATFATLIGNLLADLAYAWLDPRISVT